jgi:hypothetical protein
LIMNEYEMVWVKKKVTPKLLSIDEQRQTYRSSSG